MCLLSINTNAAVPKDCASLALDFASYYGAKALKYWDESTKDDELICRVKTKSYLTSNLDEIKMSTIKCNKKTGACTTNSKTIK